MKFSFVFSCLLIVLASTFGRTATAWGAPEEEIEVRFQNPTEIFSPRETIILEIRPRSVLIDKLSAESQGEKTVNLHVALSRHAETTGATTSGPRRRQEAAPRGPITELELQVPIHGEDPWIPVSLLAPMEEGAYEITISLYRKADRTGNSLLHIPLSTNPLQKKPSKILVETTVHCIVFDSATPARPSGDPVLIRKELLDTVDAAQSDWRKRLIQMPSLPKVGNLTAPLTAPLSSGRLSEIPRLGTFRERPPKNPAPETDPATEEKQKSKPADPEPLAGVLAELLEQWKSNSTERFGSGHLTEEISFPPPTTVPTASTEPRQESTTLCSLSAPKTTGTTEARTETWEALPLSVQEIGRPHLLELDYPSNRPQELGIRIVEMPENPGGPAAAIVTAGSNLHVVQEIVSDNPADNAAGPLTTHRILFWPKTKNPMLLLVNRQPRYDAVFGNARLYRISTDGATETSADGETRARLPKPISGPPRRRVFGYLHRNRTLELLATGSRPAAKPYRPTRYNEMLEGAERLVDTLLRGGYDGVLLTIASKDSTLYPTERYPTERYPTGRFGEESSSADEATEATKDQLELLYRHFDREQMTLVSAIDFDQRLRKIEDHLLEHPSQIDEIYWDPASDAARYNLLHPLVQEAMIEVVAETVGRYSRHPSFGGLAVQLSPEGYARLPITVQAVDDRTFSEFLRESAAARNITFPPEPAVPEQRPSARARFIQGDAKAWEAWVAWRSQKLRDFYAKLTKIVTDARPETKFYLAGGTMLDTPELRNYCTPTLTHSMSLNYVLQITGFDLALLNEIPSLVFLRPSRIESTDVCYEQFDSAELGTLFLRNGSVPGTLFFHGEDETSATVPAGNRNRRRFVKHLAQTDVLEFFDGGNSIPFGGGEHLYDFIAAYRRLPPVPFQTFVPEKKDGPPSDGPEKSIQPVTVRFSKQEDGLVVYLLNDAPFAVEAVLGFSPTRGVVTELSGRRAVTPLHFHETVSVWQVRLEPYDFQAVVLSDPRAVIRDVHVRRPAKYCGPDGELHQKVDRLNDRIRDVRQGITWDKLENLDFETVSENPEQLAGWTKSEGRFLSARSDSTIRASGRSSVKLDVQAGIAEEPGLLWSDCFESPSTGRLFVSFSIGTGENTNPRPLNVVLAGRHHGRDWVRSFTVQPASPTGDGPVVGGVRWHRALVAFDRLPPDSLEDLRLGFQPTGAGTVWLDDVSLYHVSFTPGEIKELQRLVLVARARCSQERVSELMTILEGHWSQFLFHHVPPHTETVARSLEPIAPGPQPVTDAGSKPYAENKAPAPPTKEEPPKKENRGILDRLRGLFGR